jgi:NNP family nitrate/nitrite transporter-like MFS transporter
MPLHSVHISSRRYAWYDLEVVPEQDYKASEFKLATFGRPHMRAFHYAWFGFFLAEFVWFAIFPLTPYMASDLKLSSTDLWTATFVSYTSSAFVRVIVGPLCDVYGPRLPFAAMLCLGSIPAALTGVIQTPAGLIMNRFFYRRVIRDIRFVRVLGVAHVRQGGGGDSQRVGRRLG